MAATKHGARLLEKVLRANQLDRRTNTAKEFHALQEALAADRGGWDHCTAGEKMLIERAASLCLICRAIERWALTHGIVDQAGTLSPPLFKGYTSHASALQRTLATLGLRPDVVERLPDVREYLERAATEDAA
jgi:hypothetical protein